MAGVEMYVESKAANEMIKKIEAAVTPERAEQLTRWALDHAGRKVKGILKNDLIIPYNTKKNRVGKDVKNPINKGNSCVIPLNGQKYTIGGGPVTATGGVPGWQALKYAGKGYKITAKILKNGKSTLPSRMKDYGGQPPFRNTAASGIKAKLVFTRKTKKRYPIAVVAALATPQMPPNRSEAKVRQDIEEVLYQQMEHYFLNYAFK